MRHLSFVVHGTPAPQGSKRGFVVKNRAVIVDDNKPSLRTWRQDVKLAAREALEVDGGAPFDGAVFVSVVFRLAKPKSTPRRVVWPVKKPDVDKLGRAILDALEQAGVFYADSQVVDLTLRKRFTNETPRAVVTISEAEG